MNFVAMFISLLKQVFSFLSDQIFISKRASISAYKRYERKARHDFQRQNKVRLGKNEQLTPASLLCLDTCHSVDEAIKKLENNGCPDAYIIRLVYIWDYYEHIDVV